MSQEYHSLYYTVAMVFSYKAHDLHHPSPKSIITIQPNTIITIYINKHNNIHPLHMRKQRPTISVFESANESNTSSNLLNKNTNQQKIITNKNKNNEMPKTISHRNSTQRKHRQTIDDEDNDGIGNSTQLIRLRDQNKKARLVNKELKRQLENFEKRLDQSIEKQNGQNKRKLGQEIVQNMELQNAYKMCQIYKRQIAKLKKKENQNTNDKVDELENLNFQLRKQKQKLLEQIKDLKKVVKQQEKGLKEMAGPNAMKLLQENQKLRQSIRRLQNLYDVQQKQKINSTDASKNNRNSVRKYETNLQKSKIKTQKQQENGNEEIAKLKNRIIKANRKISALTAQNAQLKQSLQELRSQVLQRNKDIGNLRQKIGSLRKKQQQSRRKRIETEPEPSNNKRVSFNPTQSHKIQSSRHMKRKSQLMPITQHAAQMLRKFPKIVQKGQKSMNSLRWSHQQLSSKIKQIQVYPHPDGHIKEVNFRYQKGQMMANAGGQYGSFACQNNSGQYIKYVRGGFKDGLLRYVSVETSLGRRANFCEFDLEDQCENFQFSCRKNQYLGAFFGENTHDGVCRIGCLIQSNQ